MVHAEVDEESVNWLNDVNADVLCEQMGRMIAKCRQLHKDFLGVESSNKPSREHARRRINILRRGNTICEDASTQSRRSKERNVWSETVDLSLKDSNVEHSLCFCFSVQC